MNLMELLGQYLETMNLRDGPDSIEAKKLVEEYKDNVRFVRLAKTASMLWRMRH